MNDTETAVRQSFDQQAEWCRRLGSPFTALLCGVLGNRLDRASAAGARVLGWESEAGPVADALALRLAGGLNALVRSGRFAELAAHYPPNPLPDENIIWPALQRALDQAGGELLPWLDSAPQTNEVGRSAPMMAGLLVIAAEYDLPFSLYEIGASAGLNLLLERYAYQLGGTIAGDPASALRLAPEWRGASPPAARVQIAARRGADLQPLDTGSMADRERLMAYVWPDQLQRVSNLAAALGIAAARPPVIDRDDAAAWAHTHLGIAPEPGVIRVLMHTIAFQYFSSDTKARIHLHLESVGEKALASAPFAWLRYEPDESNEAPSLHLTLWPGGVHRVLASGHPHGRSISWSG